ncbi:MAG: nucleotidyltransferase domain-containing protein [Planctomycetota bacterium]|jgi:predicted nucleotidyltransferase
MVDPATISSVRNYLRYLSEHGVDTPFAMLFGSRAKGGADEWSDIDVVIVSPVFDRSFSRKLIDRLWRTAARVDSRIEPIPCGERQWREDNVSPILEVVRKEGIRVSLQED